MADQLGHADTQMVRKVYGVYKPSQAERRKWELVADAADAERRGEGPRLSLESDE